MLHIFAHALNTEPLTSSNNDDDKQETVKSEYERRSEKKKTVNNNRYCITYVKKRNINRLLMDKTTKDKP